MCFATDHLPPILEVAAILPSRLRISLLVDSGASVSLLPPITVTHSHVQPSFVRIASADGAPIRVHGEVKLSFSLPALRRTFNWTFVVADVSQPILGADFIAHHRLLIDLASRTLTDMTTSLQAPLSSPIPNKRPTAYVITADIPQVTPPIHALLTDYVQQMTKSANNAANMTSPTVHVIDTGDSRPVFARPRQLSSDKLSVAKQEFQTLLEDGVIRPSNSSWASPLHLVPKKNSGEWRPV